MFKPDTIGPHNELYVPFLQNKNNAVSKRQKLNPPCMDKDIDKRQQLILEVLAFKAEEGHAEVVAQALRAWNQLAVHLTPLIGEAGFCALYGRAMRIVSADHEWLAAKHDSQSVDVIFTTLKESLLSIDSANAGKANTTLLDTFTKLLSGLIGAALTTQLLNAAWVNRLEESNRPERSK